MELFFERGAPHFERIIHVNQPNIAPREKFRRAVEEILDSRQLTNDGPYVRKLEELVARSHDVRHCVAVCNGTLALQLAIRALGLTGEVIVPSLTFVATAHALEWQGVTPVFCDVDPETLTMDPRRAEELVSEKTSALLPVHVFGRACATDALADLARRRGLKVLYDAAHCFGASVRGRKFGGFGDAEIFSFHATKIFNTFEGGAVLTNDDALAARLRLMRNFGFVGYDRVDAIGTNAKMPELSAAHGCALIDEVPALVRHNRDLFAAYRESLRSIPGVALLEPTADEGSNFQYVVILIDGVKFGLARDELYDALWSENVRARRYFFPGCHRMEPYASSDRFRCGALTVTERVLGGVLCLPTGPSVTVEIACEICALIAACRERADALRAWLRGRTAARS